MNRCSTCRGFVTASSDRCPNCSSKVRRVAAAAFTALAGGSVAVTLMACYGCPGGQCMEPDKYCPATSSYVERDASCPDADTPDHDVAEASVQDDASEGDASEGDASDAGSDAAKDAAHDADAGAD